MTRRKVLFVAALTTLLGVAVWGGLAIADTPEPRPGTSGDVDELKQVYRRYERIFFDALVTGEVSAFPTVFFNDLSVEMRPELHELISKYRSDVAVMLSEATTQGPVGAETGFLSAQTAYIANLNRGTKAWRSEQEQARSEGREPSAGNLPPGVTPYQRPTASEWVPDVPVQFLNVRVSGNHATADVAFVESEQLKDYLDHPAPYMQHIVFTRVDGQWYISYIWSDGMP